MSRVCMCDRLSPKGVHTFKWCPFYGMHWSEVAAELEATDPENRSAVHPSGAVRPGGDL